MPDGLQSGGEQDVLQAQRDTDRAERVHAQRDSATKERDAQRRGDGVRVSINAPHRVDVRGNQIALNIAASDTPAGDSVPVVRNHPFEVIDQSNPDDGLQVKVYKDSFLYPTTDLTAPASISGLDAIQSVSVGDVVALRIALNSDLSLDGTPDIIFTTGDWSGYPAMYSVDNTDPDNPFIDEIRVLVAEIVDVSDTRDGKTITDGSISAKIIQHQRNNILLFAYPDAAGIPTYIPLSI